MAMEDALVLGRCLSEAEEVTTALKGYESLRRSRVAWVASRSRRVGQIGQWQRPVACWMRSLAMRMTPQRVAAGGFIKLLDEAP